MNRHLLPFSIGFIIAGLAVFLIMRYQSQQGSAVWAAGELMSVRQAVEKRLADLAEDITGRLAAFAQETKSDELFALRLIAENNPSAPEVAGKAGQFMGPMGFAFLSIVDSTGTILSSGHFPSSRGDRMLQDAFRKLSEVAKFVEDGAAGAKMLSLQARTPFTVADSITFFALGGTMVDGAFLARLAPLPEVKVLLRRGGEVLGMDSVKTMSKVTDGGVLINGRRYQAFTLMPDYAGEGDAPELIGVLMK